MSCMVLGMKVTLLTLISIGVWCNCMLWKGVHGYSASSRLTPSHVRTAFIRRHAGLSPPGGSFEDNSNVIVSKHRQTRGILSVLGSCLLMTCDTITNLFPLWVLAATILGYIQPGLIRSYMHLVSPALALTMGFMGMTLTGNDFLRVLKQPQYVLLGMASQFTIMPLLASKMAKMQQLPSELSAGLILVGCAPGGTASNLVTLIAKADVALSGIASVSTSFIRVFTL